MANIYELKRLQRLNQEQATTSTNQAACLRVALVYPNTYSNAMSNLGFQGVYHWINLHPECVCERIFWPDLQEQRHLQQTQGVLRSFEHNRTPANFDVIAFSLAFENDYLHLPAMFEMMRLPLDAHERSAKDPLIVAGGVCTLMNPEPVAPWFDLMTIGEAEVLLPPLLEALLEGASRAQILYDLATKPGFYVPALYTPEYAHNGVLRWEVEKQASFPVKRQWLADLDSSTCRSFITTNDTAFGDMRLVEVSRGCGRGCRFCATGFVYLPPRERSATTVLEQLHGDLCPGVTAGLVGAAVSDYSALDEVAKHVCSAGAAVSVASLRVDSMSREQVEMLRATGQKTIALAPEAGSQRLRDAINKNLSTAQIVQAAQMIAAAGIPNLKLYFLFGLPTETDADIQAMIELVEEVREVWLQAQRSLGRLGEITLSVNPFIPKAMTPFQWHGMAELALLKKRVALLRQYVKGTPNMQLQVESLKGSQLQTFLSRADRRAADVIRSMAQGQNLKGACRTHEINLDAILYQSYPFEHNFPWDIIDSGVARTYLWREYQAALGHLLTPACPLPSSGCTRCGVCA
ncbi:MAG: radical SAM protein [Desulfuromonadaceae bacterium]|nr:radical SAM protein [Desulfuromonadaceae bacterium]